MNPSFDVGQQLLRHGRALRRLADELVRDPGTAEDAVQEVWVAALQQGPRQAGSVGGWLRTVLVHVVARVRRGEQRRVVHEAVAGAMREGTAEDHAVVLARQELAERLLAALRALEPPYEDALWQRYFEGKTPAAIASASGVAVATVKSRLQRGLGMLRERLGQGGDANGGDWRGAFVVAFGLREGMAAPAAAAMVTGGVLMTTATKWAAIAAAAIVLTAVAWWPKPHAAPPADATSSGGAAVLAAAAGADESPASTVTPTSLQPAEDRRLVNAAAPAAGLATVYGRCVDDQGKPIAGAVLEVHGSSANAGRMEAWLKQHDAPEPVQLQSAPTGDDGRFALEFAPPPPFRFFVFVRTDGRADMTGALPEIAVGATIDLGDVVMCPGVLLQGRVLDPNGLPIADVQIDVQIDVQMGPTGDAKDPLRATRYLAARTDARGAFTLRRSLAVGTYRLRLSDDFEVRSPDPIELVAARRTEEVVVVAAKPDLPTITGKVLDQDDRPVRGVTVAWGPRVDRPIGGGPTKSDGTFELRCTNGDAKAPVRIRTGVEGCESTQVPGEIAWGTRDLLVRVFRPADLDVRVLDAEGNPVVKYRANVEPREQSQWGLGGPQANGDVHGLTRFRGLARGAYYARIQFDRSLELLPIVMPFEFDGRTQRLDVRVGATNTRLLRVQFADGSPVVGTHVMLCEMLGNTFDGDCAVAASSERSLPHNLPRVLVLDECTTGKDGTVPLRGPADRVMGLRVRGAGHTTVERSNVSFATTAELVVTVDTGARLRATIEPDEAMAELRRLADVAAGTAFSNQTRPMLLLRRDGPQPVSVPDRHRPEAEREPMLLRDDGTFDVSGLPAGQWRAQIEYWSVAEWGSMTRVFDIGSIELQSGQTTTCTADLQSLLPGSIEGLVLRNGVPWANAILMCGGVHGTRPDGRPDRESTRIDTDAAGRFRFVGRTGQYSLRSSRLGMQLEAEATVDVARGAVAHQTFAFTIGTLALRVTEPNGAPARLVNIRIEPGSGHVSTNLDGVVSTEVSATIPLTLRVLPKRLDTEEARQQKMREAAAAGGGDPFAADWIVLGTATVATGETTTLDLQLPAEWAQ